MYPRPTVVSANAISLALTSHPSATSTIWSNAANARSNIPTKKPKSARIGPPHVTNYIHAVSTAAQNKFAVDNSTCAAGSDASTVKTLYQ